MDGIKCRQFLFTDRKSREQVFVARGGWWSWCLWGKNFSKPVLRLSIFPARFQKCAREAFLLVPLYSDQCLLLYTVLVFLRHKTRPLLACLASKQFFVSIVRDDAGMVHTRNKRRKSPHGQFPKFHFPRSGICIKQLNSRRHTPSFHVPWARGTEKDKFVFRFFWPLLGFFPDAVYHM